ncbi:MULTISPECIES: hypothetical protein [Shewanella]|uniref:hypothetical protein n=1 Tax=Shewanella TaxID=22 RepID=UPI00049172ED|nr:MULTISPECIES: hypothetical protein [Shewanella]
MQLAQQPINTDLHKLVIWMIFGGAIVSATGISICVWAQYQEIGPAVFALRADFLGDYMRTPLAYVYNMALIVAGLCILLAMYGLFLLKLGHFGLYISFAGLWVGGSIILMGVFPINYLSEHRLSSTSFLLGTVILHFLTLAARINHKEICSKRLFFISSLGLASALGLVFQLNWQTLDFDACIPQTGENCYVAINMWGQTNLTMLWCLMLALTIKKLTHTLQQPAL